MANYAATQYDDFVRIIILYRHNNFAFGRAGSRQTEQGGYRVLYMMARF